VAADSESNRDALCRQAEEYRDKYERYVSHAPTRHAAPLLHLSDALSSRIQKPGTPKRDAAG
jgi:hypothetical protein